MNQSATGNEAVGGVNPEAMAALEAAVPWAARVVRLSAESQSALADGGSAATGEAVSAPDGGLWGKDGRPNLGRFTDRARKCLSLARATARRLGHSCVGTGHLLSGIAHEGAGIGSHVLAEVGLSATAIDAYLADCVGRHFPYPDDAIVYESPGWSRALASACAEALRLKHNRVGSEHLLLACMSDVSFYAYGLCDMCLSSAQVVVENTLSLCAPELPDLVRAVELCTPHVQIVRTSLNAMLGVLAPYPLAASALSKALSAVDRLGAELSICLPAKGSGVPVPDAACGSDGLPIPVVGTLLEAVAMVRQQQRSVRWAGEVIDVLRLASYEGKLAADIDALALLAKREGWGADWLALARRSERK